MSQNTLPDYHFLLIASNLDADWFFDAARRYWERFRPTVLSELSLISLISPDDQENLSIAVTVVARRDRIAQLGVDLSKLAPKAYFDPVVFDFIADAQQTLDQRAQSNQPFGVPLIPTETPTPGPTSPPVYPTPGPVTEPGFITQTPTPGLPDQSEINHAGPPASPVFPTPGPVTGGSDS